MRLSRINSVPVEELPSVEAALLSPDLRTVEFQEALLSELDTKACSERLDREIFQLSLLKT